MKRLRRRQRRDLPTGFMHAVMEVMLISRNGVYDEARRITPSWAFAGQTSESCMFLWKSSLEALPVAKCVGSVVVQFGGSAAPSLTVRELPVPVRKEAFCCPAKACASEVGAA